MDAKYIHWWVQNTGTASPTPCALEFARASPAPSAMTALRLPSLAPSTLKIPQHQPPAFQVFTQVQQDTGICSTAAFPVSPKHEQGVIPPHQLRLGAEGSVQTSFPGSRGSVSTLSCGTGSSNSLRNPLQPQAVELQSRSF